MNTNEDKHVIDVQECISKLNQGWSLSNMEKIYELPYSVNLVAEKIEKAGISKKELVDKAGLGSIEVLDNYIEKKGLLTRNQLLSIANVLDFSKDERDFLIAAGRAPGTQTIVNYIRCGYNLDELSKKIKFPSFYSLLEEFISKRYKNAEPDEEGAQDEQGTQDNQAKKKNKRKLYNFADKIGVDRTTIYRYMTEKTKKPNREIILKMAEVLRLGFEETQLLLKAGNCAMLSTKREGDLVYIEEIVSGYRTAGKTSRETDTADSMREKKQTADLGALDMVPERAASEPSLIDDSERAMNMIRNGVSIKEISSRTHSPTISEYLDNLAKKKEKSYNRIASESLLAQDYLDDIRKKNHYPSRNKILCIAISQGLTLEETQEFLKAGNVGPLSTFRKRDPVIMEGICKSMTLSEIHNKLIEKGFLGIIESRKNQQ